MFTIRPATGSDSAAAASVVKTVFDEYGFTWEPEGYHADLYDLEKFYLSAGHRFWVAEDPSGKVVGTTALWVMKPDEERIEGCDCSLERLYLLPETRGQGLGRALMETTLVQAREMKLTAMEIWSDKRFLDAHRLYAKFGAEVIGDRICEDDPDRSEEWGLRLRL
jgi:putative acetyltransferase